MKYGKDIEKVLIPEEQIKARVKELAAQINRDYGDEEYMLVCILRGSYIFAADLIRELTGNVKIDFISISSYSGTTTSGEVNLVKDLKEPVQGRNLLIVEDIIDTGLTLSYLKAMLAARQPKSVKIAAILDKPSRRTVDLKGDYIGFEIPDEFAIGYGLDYEEKYRNLPDVCVLARSEYEK